MKSPIELTKAHGAGNDFLILDLVGPNPTAKQWLAQKPRSEWAKTWCERHFGLGADGLVVLEDIDQQKFPHCDFQWDFYNANGSKAEMCGNAARCVGLYANLSQWGRGQTRFRWLTLAGEIEASVIDDNQIKVQMSPCQRLESPPSLIFQGQMVSPQIIDSGVPHLVLEVKSDNWGSYAASVDQLRAGWAQQPFNFNVTLFKKIAEKEIASASFERGVSGYTFACGTGACAAALAAQSSQVDSGEASVRVPGGTLEIEWQNLSSVFLTGPAQLVGIISLL